MIDRNISQPFIFSRFHNICNRCETDISITSCKIYIYMYNFLCTTNWAQIYITHFLSYCHKNPSLIDVSEDRAYNPNSFSAGTNEFHGSLVCRIRCAANTRTLGRISL